MFSNFNGDFKTELLSQSTTRFTELVPVVALVLGLLLAFLIIRSIIDMIQLKNKKKLITSDDPEKDEDEVDDYPFFPDDE